MRAHVNFYISVFFIGAFGLFAVQKLLHAAQMENPIETAVAASAGYQYVDN